jgi:hypothetical protein
VLHSGSGYSMCSVQSSQFWRLSRCNVTHHGRNRTTCRTTVSKSKSPGREKVNFTAVLLSSEDDDGRDGSGESGLDAAEWSSLANPGNAGWS